MHYTVSCKENPYPYHNDAVGLLKRNFFNKVRKPFFSDVLPFFLLTQHHTRIQLRRITGWWWWNRTVPWLVDCQREELYSTRVCSWQNILTLNYHPVMVPDFLITVARCLTNVPTFNHQANLLIYFYKSNLLESPPPPLSSSSSSPPPPPRPPLPPPPAAPPESPVSWTGSEACCLLGASSGFNKSATSNWNVSIYIKYIHNDLFLISVQ